MIFTAKYSGLDVATMRRFPARFKAAKSASIPS